MTNPEALRFQAKVNRAVDDASSDFHRIQIMWTVFLSCVAAYFVARILVWGIERASTILRINVSSDVPVGIVLILGLVALGSFAVVFGIFLVSTYSLPIWFVRYSQLRTQDTDYRRAKQKWGIAAGLWLTMSPVVVSPLVLWLLFRGHSAMPRPIWPFTVMF